MPLVSFVTDEHFLACVKDVLSYRDLLDQYLESIDLAIESGNIYKCKIFDNNIDPFNMVFSIARVGLEQWLKNEIQRQIDKTVEQRAGDFHQNLLGGVEGWQNLGVGHESGVDLKNNDNSIFIELKNKHNTMNSSMTSNVREKLESITSRDNSVTAYWAYIIPARSNKYGEEVWVKKGFNKIPNVKKVWGKCVYELVVADSAALEKTHAAIPDATRMLNDSGEVDLLDMQLSVERIIEKMMPYSEEIESGSFKHTFLDDK